MNIKQWLLIIALLPSASLWAQETTERPLKKISFGLTVAPELNYRWLRAEGADAWVEEWRNAREQMKTGFSGGLRIEYRLSPSLSLLSGPQYTDRGYRTAAHALAWPGEELELPTQGYVSFHYRFLDIPLNVVYRFPTRGRWCFLVSGGLTPSVFLQRRTTVHYYVAEQWQTSGDNQSAGYDQINFYANVRLGTEYALRNNLALQAGVTAKQGLNATNSNLDVREYLYAGGLEVALLWTPYRKRR